MAKSKVKGVPKVSVPGPTTLAVTMVEQGPHDNATRIDGYGGHIAPTSTNFNTVLQNYRDEFQGAFAATASFLNLPNINLGNLGGLKDIAEKIKSINPQEYIKRFEDNVLGGRSLKSIMNLPKDFQKDAVGTIEGLIGKDAKFAGLNVGQLLREGKATYEDASKIYRAVKDGDWKSLDGIQKALGVLGNTKAQDLLKGIVDIQAVSAFLGVTLKKAAELGDHHLVKEIQALFGKENKHVLNEAAVVSMYNASARGDTEMIETILSFVDSSMIHSYRLKIIRSILLSYKLPPYYTPHQIDYYKRKLLELFKKIDPNWYKDTHNEQEVTKLSMFYKISRDAKRVLKYYNKDNREDIDFRIELMIADSYPPMDMKQNIMIMYKDISYKDRPKDPRMKR